MPKTEKIKDRKEIINHTIWVRWAFMFALVPLIVFLSIVVFGSLDKDKIIFNAIFHALFILTYNIIHVIIVRRLRKGKPLNRFLKVLKPPLEYLIFDNIAITWGIYYTGGIESPVAFIYLVSCFFTAVAYSKRLIIGVSLCSIFLYNALIWLDYAGIIYRIRFFPVNLGIYDDFFRIFFISFGFNATLLVSTFLATLVSKTINEREREIIFEKEKFNNIIRNFIDGLIILNNQNVVTLINPEAEKMLGVKTQEITGKKITLEMFSSPKFQSLSRIVLIKKEKIEGKIVPVEIGLERPEKITLQIISVPLLDLNKKVMGTMKILHDVSREKEIGQMKSEFISIAAHQLRTPLSAIKWTFKMLENEDFGKINQEQKKYLERGYEVNEQMIALVNDLLNVSRIEEGRFGYEFENVALEKIINNLIDIEREKIKEKKIQFIFKKPKGSLPKVRADEEKLSLAIQNLIDNAINYTPNKGKVEIILAADKENLTLEVRDNGLGIPKSQFNKIFGKFFRADNVIRMQTKGSGLGLFIAKNIIEKHKGKIEIKSEEGKGTNVFVSLPIEKQEMELFEFIKNLPERQKSEKEFSKFIEKF